LTEISISCVSRVGYPGKKVNLMDIKVEFFADPNSPEEIDFSVYRSERSDRIHNSLPLFSIDRSMMGFFEVPKAKFGRFF
jgi:hypothetical protein